MKNNFSDKELQVEEWIKIAQDDELNARSILTHRDGAPRGVCFLSQQIVEKYLKAFLIDKKKWYPKIHPLDALWELCHEIDNDFDEIKEDSVFLTKFYTPTRYVGDYPDFTWKDAEEAYRAASRVKEFVLERIRG